MLHEQSIFTFQIGCPPRIPGNETILYEIHVMSFVDCAAADAFDDLDEKEQSTATFQEKLDAARGFHRKVSLLYSFTEYKFNIFIEYIFLSHHAIDLKTF